MPRYIQEVTYVDRDGTEYPAKFIHYGPDGRVMQTRGADPVKVRSAESLKLTGYKTEVNGKIVDILEFKVDAIKKSYLSKHERDLTDDDFVFKPLVPILVNVGSDKRGEIWNSIDTATFGGKHMASGGSIMPKSYLKPCEDPCGEKAMAREKAVAEAKAKAEAAEKAAAEKSKSDKK